MFWCYTHTCTQLNSAKLVAAELNSYTSWLDYNSIPFNSIQLSTAIYHSFIELKSVAVNMKHKIPRKGRVGRGSKILTHLLFVNLVGWLVTLLMSKSFLFEAQKKSAIKRIFGYLLLLLETKTMVRFYGTFLFFIFLIPL